MKSIFISGIPTAGKSTLAEKLSKDFGIVFVETDNWRDDLLSDPETKKWVDIFRNLDEEKYWKDITSEEHWNIIVKQSEAYWPHFKNKILEKLKDGNAYVFEGVNLLPHLMTELSTMRGLYLVNESKEEILKRLKKGPRWGETEGLQHKEADCFIDWEAGKYREEAMKFDYPIFSDSTEAYIYAKKLLLDF